MIFHRLLLAFALSFAGCLAALATSAEVVVRELGVPVKAVNWVRLHPGRGPDGKASLLASMGQNNGGLFVLDIDLATGHCRQFNAPSSKQQYPTASFRSPRNGILYIGAHVDGHLLRYDPARPERGLEDLGAIDGEHATFPTGIAEAPDGFIWIGGYPDCSLTRFDPATGEFKRFGSMDPTDKYLYPLWGADGTLAALTRVVHPHMIAIDPSTGVQKNLGPVTSPEDKNQRLLFYKGLDGLLYLETHAGNFRIKGDRLEPVTALPAPLPPYFAAGSQPVPFRDALPMPDGTIATWDDGDEGAGTFQKIRLVSTNPAVASRVIPLDWKGGGTNLFVLHRGADGNIYGSSFLPEHIFRCAPDGSAMINLGRCSLMLGEAYTLANFSDGTMAFGSYPHSNLSLYDPRRPWRFGADSDGNPRDIGRLDDVGIRPIAMTIVPALVAADGSAVRERMWVGNLPDYGTWGGTLTWLDPKTLASGSHRHLLPDCSPFSLLWMPEAKQLLVGMSIEGGTGTKAKAQHGGFVIWDPIADHEIYHGDFGIKDLPDVIALASAGHGQVYALLGHTRYTADQLGAKSAGPTRIALLDVTARKVIAEAALPPEFGRMPEQVQFCLFHGPGGVYGITEHVLYRIKPGTCEMEVAWRAPENDQLDTPGPWIDRTFYFATGWRLRSLTLP
ncbi:MAG: hypothetical protein JWM32_2645 [Verrucomicrobia bacterium]|nr:hypothetical protein [Verrucomicrobiota bacterium]